MEMNRNEQAALRLLAELQNLAQVAPTPAIAARITIRSDTGEYIGEVAMPVRAANEIANAISVVAEYAEKSPADYLAGRTPPVPALSDDEQDLQDQLDDLFARVDLVLLTKKVLDDAKPDERLTVTQAIDGMFGHIPHWDAEDGDL